MRISLVLVIFLCLLSKMKPLLSTLKDKVVLVTGASRGIGRAIALKCAKEKANVVLLARSMNEPSHSRLEGSMLQVHREIADMGAASLPIQLDVRKSEDIKSALRQVIGEFGRVDAIVNNASAICVKKHPSMKEYDLMMEVNARGTANMIHEAPRTCNPVT